MAELLGDLQASFEQMWPIAGAEDWDAPGLVCGSRHKRVSRILLTVDVTSAVIEEAIAGGFDLVLAHHPLLLRGIKTLDEGTAKGSILSRAIRSDVAIYAAHTNADIVARGVSAALSDALELENSVPLSSLAGNSGHGRVGNLSVTLTLGELAKRIARVIPSTASGVRVSGDYESEVRRVALCGGAGDSFIELAYESAAEVYITSDLRHHPVQEARERAFAENREFALIDISHWAAEWLWLEWAARDIRDRFDSVQVVVSEIRTDPWDFAVTQ